MHFSVPSEIKKHLFVYESYKDFSDGFYDNLRVKLARFLHTAPEVSIVIPSWNEEKNILRTLSSIAEIVTDVPTELIVVNNNSTDNTQKILDRCGVKSFFEPKQGISFARQRGLEEAKGIYHLGADSDSIYPKTWIDAYVKCLEDKSVSCAYGTYSLIPPQGVSRKQFALYEFLTKRLFSIRNKKRPYLNVLGFNFGFRTEDGRKVGGFNTSRPRWSDGWMAMTLMKYGNIKQIRGDNALVWTDARRLMADGSLGKAFLKRFKKESKYLKEYITGKNK